MGGRFGAGESKIEKIAIFVEFLKVPEFPKVPGARACVGENGRFALERAAERAEHAP